MVDVRPFRGVRYDAARVGSLDAVLAPPYDVIPDSLREELLGRSPFNVVHLTLAGAIGGDWHEGAADLLRGWRRDGILRQDESPCFYAYEHCFDWQGTPVRRLGLVAVLRLDEEQEPEVYPHEHTFPAPRQDRMQLLRACRANLEPIFLLYSDPEGEIAETIRGAGRVDSTHATVGDGTSQVFWRLVDPNGVRAVRESLAARKLLIADGHHRFATAKDFRDAEWARLRRRDREAPFNFRMVHLGRIEDPALRILPTHRTLRGAEPEAVARLPQSLARLYELRPEPRKPGELATVLTAAEAGAPEAGLYMPGKLWSLFPRDGSAIEAAIGREHSALWSSLPASRLHRLILEGMLGIGERRLAECVRFHRSAEEATSRVDAGEAQAAFLLRAVKPTAVWELAREGEMMPPKSTDFYPKFPSGFVFYAFE